MAGWRWMCTMARHGAPWRSHFSGTSRNSTWPVLACLISGKVIYTHTYMYLFLIYIYICNIYIYIYIHIPNVEFSWIFLWRGWITIWASQALTGGLPKWHTPFKNSDESTQSWLVGWFTQLPLDKPQPYLPHLPQGRTKPRLRFLGFFKSRTPLFFSACRGVLFIERMPPVFP